MINLGELKGKFEIKITEKIIFFLCAAVNFVLGLGLIVSAILVKLGILYNRNLEKTGVILLIGLGILATELVCQFFYKKLVKSAGKYEIYEKGYKDILNDKEYLYKNINEYYRAEWISRHSTKYLIVENSGDTTTFSSNLNNKVFKTFTDNYIKDVLQEKVQVIKNDGVIEKFEVIDNVFKASTKKQFLKLLEKYKVEFEVEVSNYGIKIKDEFYNWNEIKEVKRSKIADMLQIIDNNGKKVFNKAMMRIKNAELLEELIREFIK